MPVNKTDDALSKHKIGAPRYVFYLTKPIGSKVRATRMAKNMSTKDLAMKCNISEKLVQSIEQGTGKLSKEICLKINSVLEVEIFR